MPITQSRLNSILTAAEGLYDALQTMSSTISGLIAINRDRLPPDVVDLLSQAAARPDLLVAPQLKLLAVERTKYQQTYKRNLTEARYRAKRRLRPSPDTGPRPIAPGGAAPSHPSIRELSYEALVGTPIHQSPANSQITTLISDGELCSPDGTILPAGTRVDILPSGRWAISPAEDQASPEDELDAALRGASPVPNQNRC